MTSDPEKKPQSQPHSHKHKSSRHHHDGRHGHHRHSSSRRHAAKEAMQSAIQIQPPTSFGDLLRQARGSRDTSPSHSRRESVAPRQGHGSANANDQNTTGIIIPPRRPLRPADVELEARRVEARERSVCVIRDAFACNLRYNIFSNMAHRDLRAALQTLSDQSLKTSRRLDDTYYSILEKVSVLRQTIGTLQELSGLTRELHENFESDTTELVEDVTGQVEAFDGFKTQQEQVCGLEERIKAGKERADALTARLDRAKERVDARAKSEAQWQAKNARMVMAKCLRRRSELTLFRSRAHLLGCGWLPSHRLLHLHPLSSLETGAEHCHTTKDRVGSRVSRCHPQRGYTGHSKGSHHRSIGTQGEACRQNDRHNICPGGRRAIARIR